MNAVKLVQQAISTMTFCYENSSCQIKCDRCEVRLNEAVQTFMSKHHKIVFVLPAFPAKSANRDKTISELPDLGETLALKRLESLLIEINQIYQPGAELIICSDGHVFNDLVNVSSQSVVNYQQALKQHCRALNCQSIHFFDLFDYFKNMSLETMRNQLVEEFGEPISSIRQAVLTVEDEAMMFNGLHRFLFEDLQYFYPNLSRNKIKKIAKIRAYQTIQRSHAWSNLVTQSFPDSIRLSIHPHLCDKEKISIKLVDSQDQWATPWHNVVVKSKSGYQLIKRHQAIKMGATIQGLNTLEAHYAL